MALWRQSFSAIEIKLSSNKQVVRRVLDCTLGEDGARELEGLGLLDATCLGFTLPQLSLCVGICYGGIREGLDPVAARRVRDANALMLAVWGRRFDMAWEAARLRDGLRLTFTGTPDADGGEDDALHAAALRLDYRATESLLRQGAEPAAAMALATREAVRRCKKLDALFLRTFFREEAARDTERTVRALLNAAASLRMQELLGRHTR